MHGRDNLIGLFTGDLTFSALAKENTNSEVVVLTLAAILGELRLALRVAVSSDHLQLGERLVVQEAENILEHISV